MKSSCFKLTMLSLFLSTFLMNSSFADTITIPLTSATYCRSEYNFLLCTYYAPVQAKANDTILIICPGVNGWVEYNNYAKFWDNSHSPTSFGFTNVGDQLELSMTGYVNPNVEVQCEYDQGQG